ncbi:hypothetical protein [Sphingomonas sp.]|uniref:hypothetical protein n=1 Tax=Sphingomonas sp. TaxID=28214 RepID=UPI001EB23F92|nr:hypothetical protein [Sphingomonas sp.]MBX3592892.1 hypothetical protein [Sphingomonas sp.]
MKRVLLPLAAVAALGLAACSEKAQNETAEAAEAVGADANATMTEAANDVESATDRALGSAENAIDRAGNAIDSGADKVDNAADAAETELKK